MEKDDEVSGEANNLDTDFRKYDPRLGRWFSVDPKASLIPFESPYSFANNMPVFGNDPEGEICVPCIIIVVGLLMSPEVANAPTLNSKADMIGYQNAKNLQANWILYSITAGGLSSSNVLATTMRKELFQQLGWQLGLNGTAELINGIRKGDLRDFNFQGIVTSSIGGLDLFDAYVGKLNLSKLQTIISSSVIDISPEDAKVLGFSLKDLKQVDSGYEISINVLFNAISEFTDGKIAKTNVKNVVKKLLRNADNTLNENFKNELINQLGQEQYDELMNEIEKEFLKTNQKSEAVEVIDKTKVKEVKIPKKRKKTKREKEYDKVIRMIKSYNESSKSSKNDG